MAQKYSIQLLSATTAQWESSTYVIPNGELVAELREDDRVQLKIGNGKQIFVELPYIADKGLKGDPFTYEDFTEEQFVALKGEKGDPFTYEDFTVEQLESLRGATGRGLVVQGHYSTINELQTSIPQPSVGDAYSVGVNIPYDIYIYDGVYSKWLNYGSIQGNVKQQIWYGEVWNAPDEPQKIFVTSTGDIQLSSGTLLVVHFVNGHSANSMSFYIDSGKVQASAYAKPSEPLGDGIIQVGDTVCFVCDGEKYIMI